MRAGGDVLPLRRLRVEAPAKGRSKLMFPQWTRWRGMVVNSPVQRVTKLILAGARMKIFNDVYLKHEFTSQ